MADNVGINASTDETPIEVAADEVAGVKIQRVKIVVGADGVNDGDIASGNPFPVSGPLTDAELRATALPVSVASIPSHAVTNAGTFAVQVDGTALTNLTDIETNTDSGAVVGNGAASTAQRVTIASDSTGTVAATQSGSWSVGLSSGTNAIGKLAANAGVTIGAVEIAATQTLSTVTTVGTVTTITGGGVAHDGADSGNPIKFGAVAIAGLSTATLVAAADRTNLYAGLDGAVITRPHCGLEDIVSGVAAITDGSSTSTIAAQGSGVKTYITSIVVANSSATAVTVDIRDGAAGTVKLTVPAPANTGGVVINLPVPLPFSANTAVCSDPSASASTVTVTLIGFKSKV